MEGEGGEKKFKTFIFSTAKTFASACEHTRERKKEIYFRHGNFIKRNIFSLLMEEFFTASEGKKKKESFLFRNSFHLHRVSIFVSKQKSTRNLKTLV